MLALYFILAAGLFAIRVYLRHFVPLRPQEEGFEYVHVEEDGSVRELDDREKEYLKADLHPADSGRPYIKSRYGQLTPDRKIWGFMRRRRVPRNIVIRRNGA